MVKLKENTAFKPIKLVTPNGLGGHNIYPSSKSGFSTREFMDIWDWFKQNNEAESIYWDSEEKCLVTMSVKEN